MARITLITGGARSGKSAFALSMAERCYARRAFVATAVAFDHEMRARIMRHRLEREDRYTTVEEPLHLDSALAGLGDEVEVAVVDCLTVWLGNVYHALDEDEGRVSERVGVFVDELENVTADLILVTNEVGWGIVPDNALSRSFRDTAGRLNRLVAEKADNVYLVCAGIPLRLKGVDDGW